MATVLTCRNANDALVQGIQLLKETSYQVTVRRKSTLEYPGPVITTYHAPWERVMLHEVRDANPFFHLIDGLWVLAGRKDVELLSKFNSNIAQFSDDGKTFHGAYGDRLRWAFEIDQLAYVIRLLQRDPSTRRAVLGIWNPYKDLDMESNDIPCNNMIYFRRRGSRLDMTVCCRSNDLIWGLTGSNFVQFTLIHEYVAKATDSDMGIYDHLSNSYHVYNEREDWQRLSNARLFPRHYPEIFVTVSNWETFLYELEQFFMAPNSTTLRYKNAFFLDVLRPMWNAWFRHKEFKDGLALLDECKANDWRQACQTWMSKRENTLQSASTSLPGGEAR